MVELLIKSAITSKGRAKMVISNDKHYIDITILSQRKQFDFTLSKEEWDQLKHFIEDKV